MFRNSDDQFITIINIFFLVFFNRIVFISGKLSQSYNGHFKTLSGLFPQFIHSRGSFFHFINFEQQMRFVQFLLDKVKLTPWPHLKSVPVNSDNSTMSTSNSNAFCKRILCSSETSAIGLVCSRPPFASSHSLILQNPVDQRS